MAMRRRLLSGLIVAVVAITGVTLGLVVTSNERNGTSAAGAQDPSGRRDADYIERDTGLKDVVVRQRTAGMDIAGGLAGEILTAEYWVEIDKNGRPVRTLERIYGSDRHLVGAISHMADGRVTTWDFEANSGDPGVCHAGVSQGSPLDERFLPPRFLKDSLEVAGWTRIEGEVMQIEAVASQDLAALFPADELAPVRSLVSWASAAKRVERFVNELPPTEEGVRRLQLMLLDAETSRAVGWRTTNIDRDGNTVEGAETLYLSLDVFPRSDTALAVFTSINEELSCGNA
jgi:hypothetical protein